VTGRPDIFVHPYCSGVLRSVGLGVGEIKSYRLGVLRGVRLVVGEMKNH
jgi:hypothetical protein